jgi:DNA-binding CsgD family transcriptional regulator
MATLPPGTCRVKRRPRKGRVRDAYGRRVKALARHGHGIAAIARRLSLDPGTVRKILLDAGLLKPRGMHPVREKVLPLVEQGLTLKEAAEALGVSPNLANYHHQRAGGKALRPADSTWPGSPRRAAELFSRLEAYRERTGMTWKEVAARCGLTAPLFSLWHAGKRVPSDYTLNAVERFLAGENG